MKPCPKCQGRMVLRAALFDVPAHDSCVNCGLYLERPFTPVMKEFPSAAYEFVGNQFTRNGPPFTPEEKRRRNREAQARCQARKREARA